jgi:hypothetical protein
MRLNRPVGRLGLALLVAAILSAPWLLFFDPIAFLRRGHIVRDPIAIYRLYSDDFAYVAASRTLSRTIANLFVPHNTHIVPAWRVLTWVLVSWSGSLEKLPEVLAEASYGILAAVMMLMGRLVARETGRAGIGLAAMAAVGTTSLMAPSACWYSAGQTLWAGFGVLSALWYAQCFRRSPRPAALVLGALSAMLAGWSWTIGHVAGPVAALYLVLDGRRRCRLAAAVPLTATALAVGLSVWFGGGKVDSTVSFHGRTTGEAAHPVEGLQHTAQAIPENLVLGNLGLKVQTTQTQGVVLTLLLLGAWSIPRWRRGGPRAFNPLECTGLALLLASYLVEWTVRGYMPFRYLRTINLGMIVPWYDTVPQIGAVLFAAGWFAGARRRDERPAVLGRIAPLCRRGAIGVVCLMTVLVLLNRPRVDLLWRSSVPPLLASEQKMFPILTLQSMRATSILLDRAEWQRRHLRRLQQAREVARQMGIGLDSIKTAFGRIDIPELPDVYDAAGLLDLPDRGRAVDPALVRRGLGPYLFKEQEPRPRWLPPGEPWPPPAQPSWNIAEVDVPG